MIAFREPAEGSSSQGFHMNRMGFGRRENGGLVASLLVGLLVASGVPGRASAQITLDQFRTAETPRDGFAISRPTVVPHMDFSALIVLDYALNPLVYETNLGSSSTEAYSVVQHQLVGTAMVSYGLFNRAVIYAGIPVNLVMRGDTPPMAGMPSADGTGIGDMQLGARLRILGDDGDFFRLGAQVGVTFPLAKTMDPSIQWSGDRTVVALPRVMGEFNWTRFRLNLQVGGRFRGDTTEQSLEVGQELTYGAGLAYHAVEDKLDVLLETYGSFNMGLDRTFNRQNTPLEALAGVKYWPSQCWVIGGGVGTALTRGYGSPDLRAVASLGYVGGACEPEAAAPPPPVDDDLDDDGILDASDACPTDPEDRDGWQDEDGCPDPDNDGDGVLDASDGAPNDPEDADGFQDADGVPDPDNDGDGILDADDRCPTEPEDRDGIQDEDGCPETDADADTIVDPEDHCPLTPGVANAARPDCSGCPALACVVEGGTIEILQRVEFGSNSDVILERSNPVLEAVQQILSTNPQIRKLRVEGHTDDRGNDQRNLDLSNRRAASVVRWLVDHGVDGSRLESQGFGETRPIADNRTNAGRQTNRRVEFHITDPAPAGGSDTTIQHD